MGRKNEGKKEKKLHREGGSLFLPPNHHVYHDLVNADSDFMRQATTSYFKTSISIKGRKKIRLFHSGMGKTKS